MTVDRPAARAAAPPSLPPAATTAAEALELTNALRTALLALGLCQTGLAVKKK